MVGPWSYLGVQAAGVGPQFINRAAAGLGIQKMAITAGSSSQAENAVFEVEMLDVTCFGQALGNVFGVVVVSLKGVHQTQADQIRHFHLNRHGAAIGGTRVAQTRSVLCPSFTAVNVHNGNG
jgi:hypothetical protein